MYCFHCGSRVDENADFCHHCGQPIAQVQVQTSPLEKLDADGIPEYIGKYKIKRRIGIGGMGIVYEAYDENLQRVVAIKVLPSRLAKRPGYAERFLAEAHRAAELEHPNIVMIHDVGTDGGRTYFVMNLLTGSSLEHEIAKKISIKYGLQFVIQLVRALGFAHSRGVVHCDVKPGNVIIGSDDHVTLLDFGIAKTAAVQDNTAVGTPEYMSPEQCQGHSVDARSDIYSLGILMYKLFTNRLPFTADKKIAVAFKQINEPPIPPRMLSSDIPEWLEAIILKCLEKNPEDRYQTTSELANDIDAGLRKIYAEEKDAQRRGRPAELPPSERWRFRKRSIAGIVLGVLGLAAFVWGTIATINWLDLRREAEEEEREIPGSEYALTEDEVIIDIISRPPEATVFINDRRFGTTPLKTRLQRGRTYTLRFEKEEYNALETEFTPSEGDIVSFEVQLNVSTYGWLTLTGPEGADVWIDDIYIGKLPKGRLQLISGEHKLKVATKNGLISRDFYVAKDRVVTIAAGSDSTSKPPTEVRELMDIEEAESILLGTD
ncbi:protein kinase [bacterium]|nr:protein kinase [bacterium]